VFIAAVASGWMYDILVLTPFNWTGFQNEGGALQPLLVTRPAPVVVILTLISKR
jgi:hypothetical protein